MLRKTLPIVSNPGDFSLFNPPFSIFLRKSLKAYKVCIGKIGDLAEKAEPFLDRMPCPKQMNAWNILDRAIEKSPRAFLKLASEKNEAEKEVAGKLDLLLKCLQELNIRMPVTLATHSIDLIVEQLECVYEIINDHLMMNSSARDSSLLIEANDLILDLQNLLQSCKRVLGCPNERAAKEKLKDNPLLSKLVPLTLVSSGGALSAFAIDQQGILPSSWNPNSYVSDAILSKARSIIMGSWCVDRDKAAILGNVTMIAGTCALSSFDDHVEESGYLEYFLSSLVNQVFVFTFAYLGTRFCGSKEKVKGFVENRISSTITYKACNTTLSYLGIPFWSSKTFSLLASGTVNPLLSLVD